MEKKEKIQKRVATRPIPGRDSQEQLEINAKRREKYAQRWEKIQEARKLSKKKLDALNNKLKNEDEKPEHFLRTSYTGLLNAKQQPEYLLLRQRFRAIFLWPEILAGHAPPQVRLDLPPPQAKPPGRPRTRAAPAPAPGPSTDNVIQVQDVSDQKDHVLRGRSRRGRGGGRGSRGGRGGRGGGREAKVGMPSQGKKYLTSWEREQARVAALSGEPLDLSQAAMEEEEVSFAVSSLSEQTFQDDEAPEEVMEEEEEVEDGDTHLQIDQ